MADRKERTLVPTRDPAQRIQDFAEVSLGFSEEQALAEASRCLNCKTRPCVAGCPVGVDIPSFIQKMVENDFAGAIELIKQYNALPAVCGRVCPQESQCEKVCALGRRGQSIAIGALERFAADWEAAHPEQVKSTPVDIKADAPKVAVVGSGPASLTAAGELARLGYRVTIFESLHAVGGVLRYGIPAFRLPRTVLDREVDYIRSLGVAVHTNVVVGQTITLDQLSADGCQAVFIGAGAGLPYFMNIPGENFAGVYTANELLTRVNLMKAYLFPEYDTPVMVGEQVAVIGGGNVALDSARCALRLGAKLVTMVYRRSREEMPARAEEVEHAHEEGIQFRFLAAPTAVLADENGRVTGLACQQMELGEPDASGRRRPIPVPGQEFVLPADSVIVAVGAAPNPLLPRSTPTLATEKDGRLTVDPQTLQTSLPGVFAGGDIANDEGTVIAAMGNGKQAAHAIDEYLKNRTN